MATATLFTFAVVTAFMTTLVASQSDTTTSSTYDWNRCKGGPKTGPRGLYERLCNGEEHGECVGVVYRNARSSDLHDCAEECNDEDEACGGFEYDVHDDESSCILFTEVTGLKPLAQPHLDEHRCFKKGPPKIPKCKEEKVFSGRYERKCDFKRKHTSCQGAQLGPLLQFDSAELCAGACDNNSTCESFEYTVHDDVDTDCVLFTDVVGAEHPGYEIFHECYLKVPTTTTVSTTTVSTTAGTTAGPTESPAGTTAGPTESPATSPAVGESAPAASVKGASTAPATQILSILSIFIMIASTFM